MTQGTVPAWLLLSLMSMVLVGTADLLFRRATLSRFPTASFMVVHSLFFGPAALAWALQSGEASAAVPISQMSFVFTFVLAVPLFGEPVSGRKAVGLLAAVLAVLAFYQ